MNPCSLSSMALHSIMPLIEQLVLSVVYSSPILINIHAPPLFTSLDSVGHN